MKKVALPASVTASNGKEHKVEGNLWENYGKIRMYVNVLFPGEPALKVGYVDLLTGDVVFQTKGFVGGWADKVKSGMTVN